MNIFFTSDNHFSHRNIILYCNRPFSAIEEMNEKLVENWNSVVGINDTIYHLGDFSLHHRDVTKYVPRLNGKKHLIAGNHDGCHPAYYKKEEKGEKIRKIYYEAGFETIKLEDKIHIGDFSVKLHHMPYSGDHTGKERYTQYRPKDEGDWLLHGHLHSSRDKRIRNKMLDVGVDGNNLLPISLEEVKQIIENKL